VVRSLGEPEPARHRHGDWFTVAAATASTRRSNPPTRRSSTPESQDGNVLRRNLRTGESRSIRPAAARGARPLPLPVELADRHLGARPQDDYYAGNVVFRSTNRVTPGSGSPISPRAPTGTPCRSWVGLPTRRHGRATTVSRTGPITSLAGSPLNPSVIWAGTDDGHLQSRATAGDWTNVADRVPGVPKGTYVSRVDRLEARRGHRRT